MPIRAEFRTCSPSTPNPSLGAFALPALDQVPGLLPPALVGPQDHFPGRFSARLRGFPGKRAEVLMGSENFALRPRGQLWTKARNAPQVLPLSEQIARAPSAALQA